REPWPQIITPYFGVAASCIGRVSFRILGIQGGLFVFTLCPVSHSKAASQRGRSRTKCKAGPMGMTAKIGKMPPMRSCRGACQNNRCRHQGNSQVIA
ncbi:MAG: hypothetical protein VX698_02950, partial [Pseudomonadota bacterium]|nr:hypothetical protein [Pseudomonadota bacterium]